MWGILRRDTAWDASRFNGGRPRSRIARVNGFGATTSLSVATPNGTPGQGGAESLVMTEEIPLKSRVLDGVGRLEQATALVEAKNTASTCRE